VKVALLHTPRKESEYPHTFWETDLIPGGHVWFANLNVLIGQIMGEWSFGQLMGQKMKALTILELRRHHFLKKDVGLKPFTKSAVVSPYLFTFIWELSHS
jgi:hypothetical protein